MHSDIKKNNISIKSRYRPEIDGLRAFAVAAVIINHFNKEIIPNGYLGVDIFFVISGFVITSSLFKRPSKNFKDFISGFYERRVKRLLPALSFFILITSITICFFNPEPGTSLITGITSLFGLSNIYLIKNSTQYFAQSTELNAFTHTWSLGVEEQFYILFPLLVWFSGFGRQLKNGPRNLFITIGALAIASLIGFIFLYPVNQSAAYFLMPTRFWEIASGCLLFIGFQKHSSIEKLLSKVPPILVLTLIVGVMYLPVSWAITSTIIVVFLSSMLIGSLKNHTTIEYKIFTNPKVVYVGLLSYSLYLWHWGILAISRWTIGVHWWSIPFQIALIFGLAITSYRYIETPLRKLNWFGKSWKTIIFGGGVIVTLSGALITLGKPLKGLLYLGEKIDKISPTYVKGERCLTNTSEKTICYLIDKNSKKTLWLLGDSHARHLALSAEEVANINEMNLKIYSVNGTPFPTVGRYRKSNKKIDLQLLKDQRLVEKELYRELKSEDIILLSMRMPYHFGGSSDKNLPLDFVFIKKDGSFGSQKNFFDEWIASIVNLANIANKIGAKVIIQTPTPEWGGRHVQRRCSILDKQWFNSLNKKNCQIKSNFFIDEETGSYRHIFEKLNQLSTSHENIFLFDTFKIACPESTCNFSNNDKDIYTDGDHISYEWARDVLTSEISKFINAIQNIGR